MAEQFIIKWNDSGREPVGAPNPDYPDGTHIAAIDPQEKSCFIDLPSPAKRCGYYIIECKKCGVRVACSTAGRADDPRSMSINCRKTRQ